MKDTTLTESEARQDREAVADADQETVRGEVAEGCEGLVEAMGILPPEALKDPDWWLALSDTGPLQPLLWNLTRLPMVREPWA